MLDHDTLLRHAYQLQPLPQSCVRLGTLVNQPHADLKEITEAIGYDPVLTAKLLRVANSAYYSSRRQIGSAKEAVLWLGTGTVFGLAVAACAEPILEQAVPGYDFSAGALWQHSIAAALAAEIAKEYCPVPYPSLAFTAALLHDLGKLILGKFLILELRALCQRSIEEGRLEPYAAEAEVLSVHHGEVSGVIAQHWNLPPEIVNGVAHHHTPEEGNETIGFTTYLANAVARHIDGSWRNTDAEMRRLEATRDRLRLTRANFEKLTGAVARRIDDVSTRFV